MKRRDIMAAMVAAGVAVTAGLYRFTDLFVKHYAATPYDDLLVRLTDRDEAAKLGAHISGPFDLNSQAVRLRLTFGKARRPSVTSDDLVARYRGLLEAGGTAGRFAPSAQTDADRSTILDRLAAANAALIAAIGRWSDADLDRYQMPHPLLGKITVREMLFFTVYHQHHHMNVTSRRRAAANSSSRFCRSD